MKMAEILKRIMDFLALGYRRKIYIELYSRGLIDRKEMLENTE